jgi:hypothetical protein
VFAVRRFWALGVLAVLLSVAAPAAFGQQNPPSRVGRISYIGGSVSFEPAGTRDWIAAELNWPMTLGDRLWTDWESRAEIQIGAAVIRLGSRTGFSFLNLDERIAQMQLSAGTMIVHVRSLAGGAQDEIDTPNLALALERPGTYQVQVSPSGDTTIVAVLAGAALAVGAGQDFTISAGQRAEFRGTNTLSVAYGAVGPPDALEAWSASRDRQEEQNAAGVTEYVSPDMVGIYDLETYGSWEDTQWGYAWFPNVDAGWAPYRFGRWVWIFPWGWTWIDAEPWGFAPFHYGRWGFWHGAWCWIPGPPWERPIYAPALVAWMHGARGEVGWLPLGPRNVYVPGYAASESYVRKVNLSDTRALNARLVAAAYRDRGGQSYANSRIAGAVTSVPRTAFVRSEPADAHRVVLARSGMRSLRFSPSAPAVMPTRSSVFGAPVPQLRRTPPRQLTDRPVVARLVPPRAPVSFGRQQAAIRANGGRALTSAQWARLRPNMPTALVRLARARPFTAPRFARGRMQGQSTGRPPRPERARSGQFPRERWPYGALGEPLTRPSRSAPRVEPNRPRRGARVPRPTFRGHPTPPRLSRPPMYRPEGARASGPRGVFAYPGAYVVPNSPPPMYRPLNQAFAPGRSAERSVPPAPPPAQPPPAQPPP